MGEPHRRIYGELDSTMAEAARRAAEIDAPTWILAHRQTAARGRRGRAWQHPEGNFAATLVMHTPSPHEAALRSFVAALALRDTLRAFGVGGLSLKWPNDVLVGGSKAAGILLETLPGARLAIGIGINLRHAPPRDVLEDQALPPVALGIDDGPEAVLDVLAPAFAQWEACLATQGFGPVRDDWLRDAARLGAPIRARAGHAEHRGVFETIDIAGQLILSTPEGRLSLPAADVYF
ncbi:MAG: biotin--[acetyl-CoA-carboxylase] ligase [Pseudomonadota bacterium]